MLENNMFELGKRNGQPNKIIAYICILALPSWEMACCAESAPSEMKLKGKPSAPVQDLNLGPEPGRPMFNSWTRLK